MREAVAQPRAPARRELGGARGTAIRAARRRRGRLVARQADGRDHRRLPRRRGGDAAVPVHADLRPVGLDPLGTRDRAPRPRDRGRPLVEAVPDPVHRALLAVRPGRRALPVALARARGRAVRVRDGLPHGQPPGRRAPVRGARRASARSQRCCRATSSSATPRSATPTRCWAGSCCGPSSATSTGAATTRSTSAWWPRSCAPRRGPSSACTGCGCGSETRTCAGAWSRSRVLVPAVWFLPEWWGSGDPLRAGSRANAPNPGSAAFDDIPAFAVAHRFVQVTIAPVELGTLAAVGYAAAMWRRRRAEGETLALALGGFAWFVVVAVMTQAGFAGNQRYLIVTTAVVCVLGGDRRGARAPGRGVARARAGSARGARPRSRPRRCCSACWRARRRSSPRPTTRRACAAASSTRRTSGTTSRG